jgi:hypothetical protein
MRAALLPSRGDPITLRLVFHYFETVWQDEVDKLYINVNSNCEPAVIDYIKKFTTHPKVVFSYTDHQTDHGLSLTEMFKQGTEDHIMFVEDDSFIYRKGEVNFHFDLIEKGGYDAGGCMRWSCSGELIDRARTIFNLQDFKYGPGGFFWPCFFFAKRKDLDKTNLNFCGHHWDAGENIEALSWITPVPIDSDTFVWMSMQMRALGLRFFELPTPNDVTNPAFSWVHTTSLSSPMEYLDCPVSLRKGKSAYKVIPTYGADTGELEKKMAWMRICLDKFDYSDIKEFRDVYEKAINKAISRFGAKEENINGFRDAYKNALGL